MYWQLRRAQSPTEKEVIACWNYAPQLVKLHDSESSLWILFVVV